VSKINESSKELYEARVKRFHDAVSLKRPDRVPIATVSGHFFYMKGSNLLLALVYYFLYPRHLVSELLIF
jgi:hypothetical protein